VHQLPIWNGGVKFSPTVKIYLNTDEILNQIAKTTVKLNKPTSFYLGKLQDGLALDPLTGFSRRFVPFFAQHKNARQILLTKAADVDNLLDLDHNNHTILSWSLNPPQVADAFESNVPTIAHRMKAMQKCANASYPVRAVIMPIILIKGWQEVYSTFLTDLLQTLPLQRVTLSQICSYSLAMQLTEQKLGKCNPISDQLEGQLTPPYHTVKRLLGYLQKWREYLFWLFRDDYSNAELQVIQSRVDELIKTIMLVRLVNQCDTTAMPTLETLLLQCSDEHNLYDTILGNVHDSVLRSIFDTLLPAIQAKELWFSLLRG